MKRKVLAACVVAVAACTPTAFGQQWFFNWDGTTDITCVPTVEGNNAFFQSAARNNAGETVAAPSAGPTYYWGIVDNGSGGKAVREVLAGDIGFRWYGQGSRPEYYRGPCTTFAIENFRPDRNAFTIAFRIKAESCTSTTKVRFFNCEFETTVLNPFWPSGGGYEPYYAFRVEFSLQKGATNNDIWLVDRNNNQLFKLKAYNQAAAWHTIWATCALPPYPYATTNGVYRIWADGSEVNWPDFDRGGWSDCEVGWTPTTGASATFQFDYLCYAYGSYLPGAIAIPAERGTAPTNSIAALKSYADGTPCQLTSKIVLGTFYDARLNMPFYYICEADGTEGIKVVHSTGTSPHNSGGGAVTLAVGNIVTVKGGLQSAEGEKQISAYDITYVSAGTVPSTPLTVSNLDLTKSYNTALYACTPAQLLATAETGVVGSVTTNTITDMSKNWTADQWKNATVFLPATTGHPDLYYYVKSNTSNTLTVSKRTIRADFAFQPDIVADGVLVGNAYEFAGGKPTGPRLDGRLVRTTGTVTAVNTTAGYYDINDGGGSGDTRTLQDIWDTINCGSVFAPPNGIRVCAASPFPALGANVAAIGCAGTLRFKYQVTTDFDPGPSINERPEVRVDKVMPVVWGQGWTAAPTAGNNGPICEGATLSLTASTVSGGTYAWTGPNGFTSSAQNPSIPGAVAAATGEYGVTVTVNGLTSPASKTTATVQALTRITAQPAPRSVWLSEDASFTVTGAGHGTVTFQWKKGASVLADDARVTGSQTAALTIHSVNAGDAGDYRCVVTAGCGEVESDVAALTVNTVAADLDQDGDVDGADYGIFAGCFNGTGNPVSPNCLRADLNGDNSVDGVDYGLFAGCFNGTGNRPSC